MTKRGDGHEGFCDPFDRRRFFRLGGAATAGALLGDWKRCDASAAFSGAALSPGQRGVAVVIGINVTAGQNGPLKTPVDDSRAVVAWLIDKAGVKPGDIFWLTNPLVKDAPAGVNVFEAKLESIKTAITVLAGPSAHPGANDRLYFYFSGHGTRYKPLPYTEAAGDDIYMDPFPQDGVLPADFNPTLKFAISIPWIIEYFRWTYFADQFYFFDACRNVSPNIQLVPLGVLEKPKRWSPPRQFMLYSCAPGQVSIDIKGAFAARMLKALQGDGNSKRFDEDNNSYVVNWMYVAQYLLKSFASDPVSLGGKQDDGQPGNMTPVYRIWPYEIGTPSNNFYPVIATLGVSQVQPIKLKIQLTATDSSKSATLDPTKIKVVISGNKMRPKTLSPFTSLESSIDLEPRPSTIQIVPPAPFSDPLVTHQFDPVKYDGSPLKVGLYSEGTPIPDSIYTQSYASNFVLFELSPEMQDAWSALRPDVRRYAMGADLFGRSDLDYDRTHCVLAMSSSDPFAAFEVADQNGVLLKGSDGNPLVGLGSLALSKEDLKSGSYLVRHHSPLSPVYEQLVRLADDESREILFFGGASEIAHQAPTGLLPIPHAPSKVTPSAQAPPLQGPVGPPGSLQVSNRVIGAAQVRREQVIVPTNRGPDVLSTMNSKATASVPAGKSGLRIIFIANSGLTPPPAPSLPPEYRLEPMDGKPPGPIELAGRKHERLASYEGVAVPGPYILRVKGFGALARFSLNLLPNRRSEFIIRQQPTGGVRVLQLSPNLSEDQDLANLSGRMRRDLLCRVENDLQGDARLTRPEGFRASLFDLVDRQEPDPIALAIQGHISATRDDHESLAAIARKLRDNFAELPDTHVISAHEAATAGRPDLPRVEAIYRSALDRGLPTLLPLAQRLWEGVGQFRIEHPRVRLLREALENRIPGMLWTAWGSADE